MIDWYASSSGGTVLAGGIGVNSFTTPSISSTTIYYAEMRSTAGCGVSATRTPVTATINTVPAAAGAITGAISVCKGQSGVAYSVGVIAGATSYTWSYIVGSGVTFSGSTTNSTVADFSAIATNGSIRVKGVNGICSGTATNLGVTVNALPTISVHPSIVGQTKCQNVAATALSVTAAAVSGVINNYKW